MVAGLLAAGCEPSSITAAHNQLDRGAARVTTLTIPISQDTFAIAQFLPASDTATVNGLMGIRLNPDSVNVDVGSQLQFNNLAFSPFNFSFSQMLQTTQVSTGAITFPAPPALPTAPAPGFPITLPPRTRFSTPAGSILVSATVSAGYVVRTMTNTTNCPLATLSTNNLNLKPAPPQITGGELRNFELDMTRNIVLGKLA